MREGMRRRAALLTLSLLGAWLPVAGAENALPLQDELVVAVLDTGIDALHAEFAGYLGQPGIADPQIIAWWDFGIHRNPGPREVWDPLSPMPHDPHGHGTATASLVGGAMLGTCPGVKLAIAKIGDEQGQLVGDIAAAVRWAVKTAGADVLSMSFGSGVPFPAHLDAVDDALAEARALGVLPVASAGNGLANQGVKSVSDLHTPAGSPHALSVGAATRGGGTVGIAAGGLYTNLDPEVTAWGTDVPSAKPGGGYVPLSGTSFSAPKVAGWAACLMRAAQARGQDAGPDRLELLLKFTARDDPALPYAVEGYGFVDDATVARARPYAEQGGVPWFTSHVSLLSTAPDAAGQLLKTAWWDLTEPVLRVQPLPAGTPGAVGPGPGLLAAQGELYRVPAQALELLEAELRYEDALGAVDAPQLGRTGLNNLDLLLFPAHALRDGLLFWNELADASFRPSEGASWEAVSDVAGWSGEYVVLVLGNGVVREQPFALQAWRDGEPLEPRFEGDVLVAGGW